MEIQRQQTEDALKAKTVCVTLEGLQVKHLYSKYCYKMKKREGALEVKINGQASTLSWATDGNGTLKNTNKFKGNVVYVGEGGNTLDTQLAVVEVDKAQFADFHQKVSKAITFAKAIAAFAPPYAPAVALAGDFAELIMQFVANTVDDDLELAFHGGLLTNQTPGTINEADLGLLGYTCIDRPKPNGDSPGVQCEFRTWELPTLPKPQKISVFLDELSLDPKPSVKQEKLMFEATFGGGKESQTLKFECDTHARDLYPLVSEKLVYDGKWSGFLPFHINVVAVSDSDRKALYETVEKAIPLLEKAAQMRGVPEKEAKADAATIQNACKALQSLEALAVEFIKDKVTIGSVSGVLIRDDAANPNLPRVCQRMKPGGKLPLNASTDTGGNVGLQLRLVEGPPIKEKAAAKPDAGKAKESPQA